MPNCSPTSINMKPHYRFGWNRGFFLILSPYFDSSIGTGNKAIDVNANSECPHPNPSILSIGNPASGSSAPMMDCQTVQAAMAECGVEVKGVDDVGLHGHSRTHHASAYDGSSEDGDAVHS